jgi:hypothetical protein
MDPSPKVSAQRALGFQATLCGFQGCVNQLSVTVMKHLNNQLIRRKGLFWITVLKVSIKSQLSLWWGNTSSGGSCSPHDSQGAKKRERKKLGSHYSLQEPAPGNLTSFR